MDRREHWERVYTTKQPHEVSWFQPTPARSLELLREAGAGPGTTIIDIGAGDSTLVDAVITDRLGTITVLDISGAALARARERLGERSRDVTWVEGDVTSVALPPGHTTSGMIAPSSISSPARTTVPGMQRPRRRH